MASCEMYSIECEYAYTTAFDLQGARAVNFLVNQFGSTFLLVREELIKRDAVTRRLYRRICHPCHLETAQTAAEEVSDI